MAKGGSVCTYLPHFCSDEWPTSGCISTICETDRLTGERRSYSSWFILRGLEGAPTCTLMGKRWDTVWRVTVKTTVNNVQWIQAGAQVISLLKLGLWRRQLLELGVCWDSSREAKIRLPGCGGSWTCWAARWQLELSTGGVGKERKKTCILKEDNHLKKNQMLIVHGDW